MCQSWFFNWTFILCRSPSIANLTNGRQTWQMKQTFTLRAWTVQGFSLSRNTLLLWMRTVFQISFWLNGVLRQLWKSVIRAALVRQRLCLKTEKSSEKTTLLPPPIWKLKLRHFKHYFRGAFQFIRLLWKTRSSIPVVYYDPEVLNA